MYNVLLADDESVIINGLQCLIPWEDYGLTVKGTAANGEIALNLLKTGDYDILLADVLMPRMGGLELLEQIQTNKINVKSIIVSGYDEFEYVKRAMHFGIENYLLKPINEEELSATLLNIVNKLNDELKNRQIMQLNAGTIFDNILLRMMSGTIENDELMNRAQLLNIDLDKKYYITAGARLYTSNSMNMDSRQTIRTLQQYISEDRQNIQNSLIPKEYMDDGCCYLCLTPGNELIFLFGSNLPILPNLLRDTLLAQLNLLYEKTGYSFFAALGSISQGVAEVAESFSNTKKMLAYSFVLEHNTVVNYESMTERSSAISQLLNISNQMLDRFLLLESHEECEHRINELFSKIRKLPDLSPIKLKSLVVDLFFHIFGICENSNEISFPGDLGATLYNILNMPNIAEIQAWFILTAQEIIVRRDSKKENMNPIAKSILAQVESHYNEDICLKTIADKMHLNPTYCGQIFKQETGMLFTDYLCNYRIEQAKHLLKSTSMKSRDIAKKVGFSNSNYFANVFKKKVGTYPSKYKMSIS